MDEILGKIFNAVTGVWAIFLAIVVALFRMGPAIMGRLNERRRDMAGEEDRDWARIRHERDIACEERDLVRDRWAQSEAEKNEWMRRALKAEAFNEGIGEARQEAQRIVSIEREKDAAKRDKESGK